VYTDDTLRHLRVVFDVLELAAKVIGVVLKKKASSFRASELKGVLSARVQSL
jgi:hypothetical protein